MPKYNPTKVAATAQSNAAGIVMQNAAVQQQNAQQLQLAALAVCEVEALKSINS